MTRIIFKHKELANLEAHFFGILRVGIKKL